MIKYSIFYFVMINIIAFALYGADKSKARKKQWRISEKTLLLVAMIGGSAGSWLGMHVFHHKTKHPKFYIGVPIIFIVQIIVVIYGYYQWF